jgi:hypothetical protein
VCKAANQLFYQEVGVNHSGASHAIERESIAAQVEFLQDLELGARIT